MVCSELHTKIGKREETVGVIETLLVFTVAALYFAVVTGCVWADQLVPDSKACSGQFKACGRSLLLLEKRLVNSKPLSVCTHSIRTPRRLNQAVIFSRKSAEE